MPDSPRTSAAPDRVPAGEFMKPLHRVEWTVEKESISGKVVCDAGPQGWCRMVCTEGCESFDLRDGHEHPFRYEDECQVELWLNADCPTLTYWGPPHPATDGPIKPTFVGDYYQWAYMDGANR